ncbi:MAG: LLM class flavin-dependent oxidoreductase [Gordonia sp. (in: high G+C Gram-positive bacteria)]
MSDLRFLWYLNGADGDVPWQPEHRVTPSLDHLTGVARELDRLGYYGVLCTAREPIALVSATEKLRFLIPEYPGIRPPALMAEQAQVFDHYSNGRLIINQVNGADPVLARYGRFEDKNERYRVSAEYWETVRRMYHDDTDAYHGEYFRAGPQYKPAIAGPRQERLQIWGTGASPAGLEHAADVLDVYLSFLAQPDSLRATFDAARAAAATRGRELPCGVLASVVVRDTDEAAWEHFSWQLSKTDPARMAELADRNLRSFGFPGLDEIASDDPQVQARIDALRDGRIPDRADLEYAPGLAAGLTTWTSGEPPFDIAGKGSGNYLVGSPQTVADTIVDLSEKAGVGTWIMSGWPLADEAARFAEQVIPLLPRDLAQAG